VNRTPSFLALALFALPAFGGETALSQTAVVERVLDGDTVVVRGFRQRVRLANIDAPELSHGFGRPGQPFSVQAARWMEKKVHGQVVQLRCPDEDRYGRPVCDLFLRGEHVNKELVRAGLAWANTANARYLRDSSVLQAQREAQSSRRGLWTQARPMPPWRWRRECWSQRLCAGVDPAVRLEPASTASPVTDRRRD